MRDFDESTLWGISGYERLREHESADNPPTQLPTSLLAELAQLQADPASNDVLEFIAACVRHREPAQLYLGIRHFVWPLTLFPAQGLYHSPHEWTAYGGPDALRQLRLLEARRPGVRPPGHWMFERVAAIETYRPMRPLLWHLALHGPRDALLNEIGGRAAYRMTSGGADRPLAGGPIAAAMLRLRIEAVSLQELAGWPGLSLARASRLLNALYLTGGLLVTRSHPMAREQPQLPAAPPQTH